VGVLWLLGKKSRTSEPATKLSPVLNSETANEKKLWSLVTRTCQEQNTSQLNKAVIEWASAHWHQSVYSVSEIKALTNDAELAAVIDKLNLSLYRGDEFSDYALLLRLLEQSKLTNEPHKKNPSALQDFYPK
jgi:hypothetical protein